MWLFCGASYEGKLLFGSVPTDEIHVLLDEILGVCSMKMLFFWMLKITILIL